MMFFFQQKTAYEMRISDWSSDVCSSDLRCPATWTFCGHARPAQSRASAPRHRARGRACRSFPAATTETSRDAGPTLPDRGWRARPRHRSEEHTSELQSLMRISYAVFCLKKNKKKTQKKLKTQEKTPQHTIKRTK